MFCLTSLNASQEKPAAISPGSDIGIAVVGQSTPTFSWTAVEWARVYRVEIFNSTGNQALSHQDMAALANPVLVKEIRGAATAWIFRNLIQPAVCRQFQHR